MIEWMKLTGAFFGATCGAIGGIVAAAWIGNFLAEAVDPIAAFLWALLLCCGLLALTQIDY